MATRVVAVMQDKRFGTLWAKLDTGLMLELTHDDLARQYHAPFVSVLEFARIALGLPEQSRRTA